MARQLIGNVNTQPKNDIMSALGNLGVNIGQGASNVARNVGLGAIPDILGTGYQGVQEALASKNPFTGLSTQGNGLTAPQLQQMASTNPFMSPQAAQSVGGVNIKQALGNAAQDEAGAGGWLAGGLAGPAAGLATRATAGGLAGGLLGLSTKGGNPIENVGLGATTGAIGNAVLPPILKGAGKFLGNVVFGKAGQDIPDIVGQTGKAITGLQSPGARTAVQDIGSRIGNIWQQADQNVADTGAASLTPSDIENTISNVQPKTALGAGNSPLSKLFSQYGVTSGRDMTAAQNYLNPIVNTSTKATNKVTQSLQSDFTESLNKYAEANPGFADWIDANGGMKNIENISLPPTFWHQFASDLNSNVAYDRATNPVTGIKDFSRLGGIMNMQRAISGTITNELKNQLGTSDPEALQELESQNKLYGSATSLASGKAKGLLRPEYLARASLMLPALFGTGAIGSAINPSTKTTALPPFLAGMVGLSLLANPTLAGSFASTTGLPATQAIIPALSSILGSSGVKNLLGVQ